MARVDIPFGAHSYTLRSTSINGQRVLNCFVQMGGPGGKNQANLKGRFGLTKVATFGDGPIRGMHVPQAGSTAGDFLYVVSNNTLYKVGTDWSEADSESVQQTSGQTYMASNATQILVVEAQYQAPTTYAWVYDVAGAGITQITKFEQVSNPGGGASFINPLGALYADTYGIVAKQNSQSFYISDPLDFEEWLTTEYTNAEAHPDNTVGLAVVRRNPWVFGEQSVQIYQNTGNADFPYQAAELLEVGCKAANSIARVRDSLVWLGQSTFGDNQVYQSEGFGYNVISDPAVEYAISQYATQYDAFGFTFVLEGHTFYVLTFPSGIGTWAYDFATQRWAEWKTWGLERHIANSYAFFNGKHLIGDYRDGSVYQVDPAVFTDDGTRIEHVLETELYAERGKEIRWDMLYADFESGVGLITGQGEDPQAMLQFSDDEGDTWSNELWNSIGKIGEGKWRCAWGPLGTAFDRQFRITHTDPTKFVMTNLYADLEVLEP